MTKLFMLGFATPDMIRDAMRDAKQYVYDRTLFDVGYPSLRHSEALMSAARDFNWNYQKIENLGTAGNWNYAWRFCGRPEFFVGIEPDERPSNKSWISRAVNALMEDKTLGYIGLGQSHFNTMYDVNPDFFNEKFTVGNEKLKNYKTGIGWAMGAVSGAFMAKVGMKGDPFYGNVENTTALAMKKAGFRWGLFDDIHSVHVRGEPAYEQWKVLAADHKTNLSFKDWLLSSGL